MPGLERRVARATDKVRRTGRESSAPTRSQVAEIAVGYWLLATGHWLVPATSPRPWPGHATATPFSLAGRMPDAVMARSAFGSRWAACGALALLRRSNPQ